MAHQDKDAWRDGLRRYLDDPAEHADVITYDDEFVVVQDKYPKATVHFLVIPRQVLSMGVGDLDREHLPLLRRMADLVAPLTASFPDLQVGFHSVPSMRQLHLHVVSTDFSSPSLKHKKHWHSFTTTFFKPLADVLSTIDSTGQIAMRCERERELLEATMIVCNQCATMFKTLPQLKRHLISVHPATVSLDAVKQLLSTIFSKKRTATNAPVEVPSPKRQAHASPTATSVTQ
ncbi:hypothetical protein DYB28_006607 [Aphanomyces astaci]|uniref:C2H2-type domain-containing protein n=2 Tax=Aphanomyces astaci TaxID=112090 RepID=A0A9X8DL63_APHAT|nr:hypothetical protein DYB28_006607 [Aphanomyces astaci]